LNIVKTAGDVGKPLLKTAVKIAGYVVVGVIVLYGADWTMRKWSWGWHKE
jgi:hypothetical protein